MKILASPFFANMSFEESMWDGSADMSYNPFDEQLNLFDTGKFSYGRPSALDNDMNKSMVPRNTPFLRLWFRTTRVVLPRKPAVLCLPFLVDHPCPSEL